MTCKTILKICVLILFSITIGHGQSMTKEKDQNVFRPNLQDEKLWEFVNKTSTVKIKEHNRNGIKLTSPNALMVLKNYKFEEGSIEFDVKGRDVVQQSFPGIAFHIQNDSACDVVYFRPFNFAPADTSRRHRAVQYISLPKFEWWYLREHFPLKYENKVNPVPKADEWFNAKVVIDGRKIRVFVNNSTLPSLEVEKLTDTKSGEIGLWDSGGEHESDANFANLVIIPKKK